MEYENEFERFTINFDSRTLEQLDRLAGHRKRGHYINSIIKKFLSDELNDIDLTMRPAKKSTTVLIEKDLMSQFDAKVGKNNRSSTICAIINNINTEEKYGSEA